MKTETNEILSFKDVSFGYEATQKLISKLSMSIKQGEFVSIIGASGSGKSTLFRLIVGLEEPDSGNILLAKKKVHNRLGKVGYMPQQDLLMPWRTVRENAALPLELKSKHLIKNHNIDKLLIEFGLGGYEKKYPHELSGGMRQRVSFLRATLTGSNLLLLDEPFSALDAMTKLFMQEWLLEQWSKRDSTILFITHDISEALFLSDRIFVLTETPVQKLEEVIVPIQRPRTQKDLHSPEVLALKEQLIDRFRAQVNT